MTTVIRRRRRFALVATVLSAVLALGACSSGPSQVNAAAIVGGETIGVDRVQSLVEEAVRVEPAAEVLAEQRKLDLLSRAVLRQLVMHELVGAYAEEHDVTVDPGQVAQLAKQLGESLQPLPTDGSVSPEVIVDQAVNRTFDATELARDYLLLAAIGEEQAATLSVTFDYIVVAPGSPEEQAGSLREQAVAKAEELAEGPAAAERILDAEIAQGGQAAKGETFTAAQTPDIAGSVLFGTEPGNVVAFQPNPQSAAWVVAVIRSRDTGGEPDPAAQGNARLNTTLGPRLLQPTVEEVGVEISPRYGVWDLAAMAVAPSAEETVGVVVPMNGAQAP